VNVTNVTQWFAVFLGPDRCIQSTSSLQLKRGSNVVWTPGHCGILGNESADDLSTQASAIKYSLALCHQLYVMNYNTGHAENSDSNGAKQHSTVRPNSFLRQANLSFTKYVLQLYRADLRILTGLLTGHADVNRHLTFMQIWTDAVCPLCQEDEETVLHLLRECDTLSVECINILGSPYFSYKELGKVHWLALLRLSKASQRF